jgi:galactonate dehydratase
VKITDIKCYPIHMGNKNQFIVKVETDEGLYGVGEGGLSTRDLAVKGAVQHYREWLIGRDPMRAGALWQEMYRSQYFEGGRALTAAISAIDIALYDIKGKALGVPVYQLLGGKHRDFVGTFATVRGATDEETIEAVKEAYQAGWQCIRVAPVMPGGMQSGIFEPRESIPLTADRLIAVREAVGNGPVLGLDYHHRLSVGESASFCQRLPQGTLDWLEEPIRDECPEAYEALRKLTEVPFAIGEEWSSKWQALPYLERDLMQYNRVDMCNIGGFTEAMKVAAWSEAHYVDLMPHNPLGPINAAALIHLGAAVPNWAWMEVFTGRMPGREPDFDLFPVQPQLEGARFRVSDAPGLGIEFNEEEAKKREFVMVEFPRLKRKDGSHTNW